MRITKKQLRKVIKKAITESLFKSKDSQSAPGLSGGDDQYWDLARAYHQLSGKTVGGRQMDTIPSDREEVINAIESCREWTTSYIEDRGGNPPPAPRNKWPQQWLDENPGVNITHWHLNFIANWCRMEGMGYYNNLLQKIQDDKRFQR